MPVAHDRPIRSTKRSAPDAAAGKSDLSRPSWIAWWRARTWPAAFCGALLMWLAQPPVDWGWLGWVALIPWIELIQRPALPGRRPRLTIWLAGLAFWVAAMHWMAWLHPAAWIGWAALAAYLAFYPWAFVVATRWSVHRCGAPLWLAAPTIWTALEFARAHLLTGFTFCSLAYTQYRSPWAIQICDLGGFYTLSLAMALFAALILLALQSAGRARWVSLGAAAAVVALVGGYCAWRLQDRGQPTLRIALIQGNIPIEVKHDPTFRERVFHDYFRLSQRAVEHHPEADLLVWPETMFRDPLIVVDEQSQPPADGSYTLENARTLDASTRRLIREMAARLGKPLVLGLDTHRCGAGKLEHFNSAILVSADGQIRDRYDKQHLVMFGEYIPLGDRLPFLYGLTPVAGGCNAGAQPSRFRFQEPGHPEALLSVDICYESVLPHLMRRQLLHAEQGSSAQAVLVNLTNDGWYRNSSELDQHLACGVFRAVELRRPFVTAANTGISASIDACGRIQARGPKGGEEVVLAEVAGGAGPSLYLAYGDWLGWLTLAVSLVACFPWLDFRCRVARDSRGGS